MITQTTSGDSTRRYNARELKQAMAGKWDAFLSQYGLPNTIADGKGHPCPKCNGEDRFSVHKNYQENGKAFCRQCYPRGGDGFDVYQWLTGADQRQAFDEVSKFLGVEFGTSPATTKEPRDVVALVAMSKRIPSRDALAAYGAVPCGRSKVEVPQFSLMQGEPTRVNVFRFGSDDKGKGEPGVTPGFFLPEGRGPKPGETWLVVEGVKDAAALWFLGFKAIGMPGASLSRTQESWLVGFLRDVDVVLVPDLDLAGMKRAERNGGLLYQVAASVKIARLPGAMVESRGDDVRDVLARPQGGQLIKEAIANATAWEPSATGKADDDDQRLEIVLGPNESDITRLVIKQLGQLGWNSPWVHDSEIERVKVYQRGGFLVETVVTDRPQSVGKGPKGSLSVPAGSVLVRELPPAILRERIGQAVRLVITKEDKNGDLIRIPSSPPRWLVESIANRHQYDGAVKVLGGVITSPTLRPDGSVIQTPGYDESTGLLYRPLVQYPTVGNRCTREEAKANAAHIREVAVGDFPFQSQEDYAAWLAYLMTLLCRHLVGGSIPAFAVTANVRGSGKSLLLDAANMIAFGTPASRSSYSADDAELRKVITTFVMEGCPAVLFDNLAVSFGGASVDMLLTAPVWKDRLLGGNKSIELPIQTVVSLTGNNVSYTGDASRRVLPIRLLSPLEKPEDREDFNQRNLLEYLGEVRGGLVVKVLQMLQAYIQAGKPMQPGGQWGSFQNWADLIRGAVVWSTGYDPMATRIEALEQDSSRDALVTIHQAFREAIANGYRNGVKASELIKMASYVDGNGDPMHSAIADMVQMVSKGRPNAVQLGWQLKLHKKRVLDGCHIDAQPDRNKSLVWFLVGDTPTTKPRQEVVEGNNADDYQEAY